MKMRSILSGAIIAVTLVASSLGFAQVKNSENTWRLAEGKSSPNADLAVASWIAGRWQGEAFGGRFEETWNPPRDGVMMGMFRLSGNSNSFFELLTIVQEAETIRLRLKHFDKDLKGWEEKDETVDFRFVGATDREVRFEGLTFRKIDADTMHAFVVVREGDQQNEFKFECHRADTTDLAVTARDAMRRVFKVDELISDLRNHLPEKTTIAIAVANYVRGLDKIDFSGCPPEFVGAFKKHRHAWAASVQFFAQFDDLRGEMHELFDRIRERKDDSSRQLERHFKAIMSTWEELSAVADKFRATDG